MTTIATHSGKFHADDIFAVAVLEIVLDGDVEVIRTRDSEEIKRADYVVDVGHVYDPDKKMFDHHQEGGAGERKNGIPYASFGLVWKQYGEEICGSRKIADIIDEVLAQPIDAADNGIKIDTPIHENLHSYGIHDIVLAYRPTWKESNELYDERFNFLVSLAVKLLEREIAVVKDRVLGWEEVERAYQSVEDKRIIILDEKLPWQECLINKKEPLIVVEPASSEGWHAEATIKSKDDWFERRVYFPEAWAGKRDEELQRASGITDAVFAHRGRFLVVAESKHGALELAKKAVGL